MDKLLKVRESRVGIVGCSRVLGEERWRHQVYPSIGALGGKNRRHQQLKRVPMVQGAPDVGVFFPQPFENLFHWRVRFLQGILRPLGWIQESLRLGGRKVEPL